MWQLVISMIISGCDFWHWKSIFWTRVFELEFDFQVTIMNKPHTIRVEGPTVAPIARRHVMFCCDFKKSDSRGDELLLSQRHVCGAFWPSHQHHKHHWSIRMCFFNFIIGGGRGLSVKKEVDLIAENRYTFWANKFPTYLYEDTLEHNMFKKLSVLSKTFNPHFHFRSLYLNWIRINCA